MGPTGSEPTCNVSTVEPPFVTNFPQRPVFQNTKSFQIKSLYLQPLVSDRDHFSAMHQCKCTVSFKRQSIARKKIRFFPLRKFRCLSYPEIFSCYNSSLSISLLHFLSSGRLQKVKNKGNFQTFSSKSGQVAIERWSLTRGSKYIDLT